MQTWHKITAAASIILAISLTVFLSQSTDKQPKEVLTVKIQGAISEGAEISIISLSGAILKKNRVTEALTEISMKELPGGFYILKYKDSRNSGSLPVSKH